LALKENQVYGAITVSRQEKVVIFWSYFQCKSFDFISVYYGHSVI